MSIRDYYKLTRENFSLNPKQDASVYFGGANINGRIKDRLETDFLEERSVPKFMIFGQYGAGKTHTLGHIRYVLGADPYFSVGYPTEVRLTELPPLRSRDTWAKIHGLLVDELGRDLIRSAAKSLARQAPESVDPEQHFFENAVPFGDTALRSSQAKIYQALLFTGRQETVAWEWLKGRSLSADEKATLGVETDLSGPMSYLNALLNLASLVHRGLGRKVVLLVDEAESLRSVSDSNSVDEFTSMFRKLMDNDNNVLGMVLAFQSEGGMEDAPEMLTDEAVRRRVGHDSGYIDLTPLVSEGSDVKDFITEVLCYLVDQEAAKAVLEKEGSDVDPGMFPFTVDAIEALAEYVMEEPGRQVPSQIISKMSTCVATAYRDGMRTGHACRLVDEGIVNQVLYPDQES
ncbi:hypothetical protein [Oryzobacter telluris]|uniref:hypothetical protein n=1 Tax=Oryzobacter telluris TaxID=3149179 RepID=UPI00370DE143